MHIVSHCIGSFFASVGFCLRENDSTGANGTGDLFFYNADFFPLFFFFIFFLFSIFFPSFPFFFLSFFFYGFGLFLYGFFFPFFLFFGFGWLVGWVVCVV